MKPAVPDAIRSASRHTRSKKRDDSDDEESLYDEENMLMDEDEEDRPHKKTRSSAAAQERRKRENRVRDKIEEKADHRENMLNKTLNAGWDKQQPQGFPSMVMPMGMMDGSQMGMQFQMQGFPQMPGGKNGQPMYVRQMVPPTASTSGATDKKPQNTSSNSDKDKNKQPVGLPPGMTMASMQGMPGMSPYGVVQMMPGMPGMQGMTAMPGMTAMSGMPNMSGMSGEMMMKGIFGGQMPANMGVSLMGTPPNMMAVMPQMGGQQGQQGQQGQSGQQQSAQKTAQKSSDKNDDSRVADMKKSMEMMYSQYPMFSMPGNQMMAVMPGAQGEGSGTSGQPQIGIMPQMINASSLSASLPQNGPFVIMPGGMTGGMPAVMATSMAQSQPQSQPQSQTQPQTQPSPQLPRTSPVPSNPSFQQQQDKKKDSPTE